MARLSFKPEGINPQGKERVYFACHPDDMVYFEAVCEDIFASQNCVIFYNSEPDIPWDEESIDLELGRMQLFVIPITSRFLNKPNEAREVEFSYATSHHIPVLPLMQEEGLEDRFNSVCGDLQFLDKNASLSDPTALPYVQKLEKYLKSVLLGDELAEQVRGAFDAYIFMSYRKKDRKYAQELMKLIHQNDFCRDIAIWYDEFLVPGENFNNAIEEAMTKSDLFTFVVTPNLLEPDNYVMKIEYPEALKAGKPILPAEMEETDKRELGEKFHNIPDPTDARNSSALSQALLDKLHGIVIDENNDDPQHNFFIGLAYLGGIDVETDHQKALHLITTAAEQGLPEAMEKLAQMYQNGEGVERNYDTSALWMERVAEYWEGKFEETGAEEDGRRLLSILAATTDAWEDVGQLARAKTICAKEVITAGKLQYKSDKRFYLINLAVSYERLGDICKSAGDLYEAKKLYEKSLEIKEQLVEETGTTQYLGHLSLSYSSLGDIYMSERNLFEARKWYEKGAKGFEQVAEDTKTVESRRNLSLSYRNLGDICLSDQKINEAQDWYMKSLEIFQLLFNETRTLESIRDLSIIYERLGGVYKYIGNLPEAKKWYEKFASVSLQIARKTGMLIDRRNLTVSYGILGDICKSEGRLSEAKEWYEQCITIFIQLIRETDMIEDRSNLAVSYERLAVVYQVSGNLSEAKKWCKKGLEIREQLARENGTVQIRRALCISYKGLGEICEADGNLPEAKEFYEKCLEPGEQLVRETGAIEFRRDLSKSYNKIGYICKSEGNQSEAKKWYEKGLKIREQLVEETGTVESLRDLSVSYNNIGDICRLEGNILDAMKFYEKDLEVSERIVRATGTVKAYDDLAYSYFCVAAVDSSSINIDLLKKAESILSLLVEQCPDVSRYAQNLQVVRNWLACAESQQ